MSPKLKRLKVNKHMLYTLKSAPVKLQKSILKNCDDEVIKAIIEIVFNILEGVHKISPKTKHELEKYKLELRKIACPGRTLANKRKVLVQKGGSFLPILLSTVLSGIIGKLLGK